MIFIKFLILLAAAAVAAMPNAPGGSMALEARDMETAWKFCGVFAMGDRDGAKRLADYIGSCTSTAHGGYGTEFEVVGIEYTDPLQNSSCLGIGCDPKTYAQVWLCNDTTENMTKNCTEIAYWMNRIIDECCTGHSSNGLSGQYFLGDGTNIVVAKGTCKISNPEGVTKNDGQCIS